MHCSFAATVFAASALLSGASAGPIFSRQVCGVAPAGTAAQTPLAQPTGINTAAACATQCKANPSCVSFLFGLANGADQCKLYSVAASSIPAETNLVAYDIGCSSIPAVVPTAANPGGLANGGAQTQGGQRQRRQQQGGNGGAQGGQGGATGGNNGAANGQNGGANGGATPNQGSHANPVNAVPAGNPAPISTPAASSLDACLAACRSNAACIAYTFASNSCKLFN